MGDRPIMFSGPMVRAILDGTKAQTRRVIEPFEAVPHPFSGREAAPNLVTVRVPARHGGFIAGPTFRLRYAPRDRLWVREAWRTLHTSDCLAPRHLAEDPSKVTFEADPHRRNPLWAFGRLRPSMFMPRWASRLTLIVTDVRVQRLQDIIEADAQAEGVACDSDGWRDYQMPATQCCPNARDSFRSLWDSLNAKRGCGWDANPWVCAITFEAHRCNIDQMPEVGTPRKETSDAHLNPPARHLPVLRMDRQAHDRKDPRLPEMFGVLGLHLSRSAAIAQQWRPAMTSSRTNRWWCRLRRYMMPVYLNDWAKGGEADMLSDFGIDQSALDGAEVLVASYTYECYSGSAYVLFRRAGKLWEVHGSHCSCYGLESSGWDDGEVTSQWTPEEADQAAILHRITNGDWGCDAGVADAVIAALANNTQ